MSGDIDTANAQGVGFTAGQVSVMLPMQVMSPNEARRHAAWLVEMADFSDLIRRGEAEQAISFDEYRAAISDT